MFLYFFTENKTVNRIGPTNIKADILLARPIPVDNVAARYSDIVFGVLRILLAK
jgi:hypothetical protein